MSKEKDMAEERMTEKRMELIESTNNADEIKAIAIRTQDMLKNEYNAYVSDWVAVALVSATFMKAAAEYLSEEKSPDENVILNMFDLFDFGVTHRESDGEKDGNYTPFLAPRPALKTLMKDDNDTEEVE